MPQGADAAERGAMQAQSRDLLVTRSRVGLWILLTFAALFTTADYLFNPGGFSNRDIHQIALLRGCQAIGIVVTLRALARPLGWREVVAADVALSLFFNAAVVVAAIVIHNTSVAPTVLMSTNMFSAAFLPWGPRAQLIVAAGSAVGVVINVLAVQGTVSASFGYNQLESFAGLAASLWVAWSLERQRLALFRSETSRAAAVAAQLEEARVADALARAGRELLEAADMPQLVQRLCSIAAAALDCGAVHVFLRETEEAAYTPVANYGDSPEQWETIRLLRIDAAPAAELTRRLQNDTLTMGFSDLDKAPGAGALQALLQQLGVTRGLFIALHRGSDLIGALHAGDRQRSRAFSQEQQRIGRGLSHLASLTMEHARVREALERADQVKAHFVATLSHELRNPIHIIHGFHALLLDGDPQPLTPGQASFVQRADHAAQELLALITATLDLSRFENKRVPLDVQRVQISDLFAELERETTTARADGPVCVDWHAPPTLELHTDPLKLKMVLRNLVTNALKFTTAGSITVTGTSSEGAIELCVADTGLGIAAEQLPSIFEPFTQAHGAESRRKGGAGLGLYIVRRLVEVLGGAINVDSRVGQGTTFRVSLPARYGCDRTG